MLLEKYGGIDGLHEHFENAFNIPEKYLVTSFLDKHVKIFLSVEIEGLFKHIDGTDNFAARYIKMQTCSIGQNRQADHQGERKANITCKHLLYKHERV